MTVSLKKIKHYQNLQLDEIKHLNDTIKARQDMVSNLSFRKKLLDYQNKKNLSSEYERIRAHLQNSSLPFQTREKLKERTEHLKKLGASAYEIA